MIDYEKALSALAAAGVRLVIVGGVAITIHGSSYVTFDLDFCYARDPENLSRLAEALRPHNPRLRGAPEGIPFRLDEGTLKAGINFTLTTDLGDIDLLGEVTGIGGYAEALAGSEEVELFGASFRVLTLDALIASKRAAGRPKDLMVLPELEALREATEERQWFDAVRAAWTTGRELVLAERKEPISLRLDEVRGLVDLR